MQSDDDRKNDCPTPEASGVGEAIKAVFDKFSNFFDILDLSFFVSGAVAASAIWFACAQYKYQPVLGLALMPSGAVVAGVILGCYILGLLCFATGRAWRRGPDSVKDANEHSVKFQDALCGHDIAKLSPQLEYARMGTDRQYTQRLYQLAWTVIREDESLKVSYALINRYWVLTATYDGLASALWVWIVMVAYLMIDGHIRVRLTHPGPLILCLILAYLSWLCSSEARKYRDNQIDEIAATLKYKEIVKQQLVDSH